MLKSKIKTKWSLAFIYEHETTKKLKQTDNLPSLGARDLKTSDVKDSSIPNSKEGL